jgi:hypothetical protein
VFPYLEIGISVLITNTTSEKTTAVLPANMSSVRIILKNSTDYPQKQRLVIRLSGKDKRFPLLRATM